VPLDFGPEWLPLRGWYSAPAADQIGFEEPGALEPGKPPTGNAALQEAPWLEQRLGLREAPVKTREDNISRKMPDKIVAARKPELKRIHSPVVQLPSVSLFTRMAKSDLGVI
jgi:hypothetical protein